MKHEDGVENEEVVLSGDNDDYSEPNAESDLSNKLKEESKNLNQAEQERREMEEAELLMEQERERQRKL